MFESTRAAKWLYGVLHGDSTLAANVSTKIFDKQAAQGTAFPYVVFQYLSGNDLQGIGTSRSMARPLFLVKYVAEGPLTEANRDAADRIDEVVGKASGDTYDGYVFHARRQQEVNYTETNPTTSKRIDHIGGIFQVWAYPA